MTAAKAQRGRPKGSGINDQQRLAEIARVIDADPRIKPTTAIKALGITDPSTIRRLRDKFNGGAGEQPTRTTGSAPACAPASQQGSQRAAPLKFADPVKRVEAKAGPAAAAQPASAALSQANAGAKPHSIPVAAMIFGFGLNFATAFFEQQLMIAQSVMKLPQVRDLVHSQIALTEFMLDVAHRSPGSRLAH